MNRIIFPPNSLSYPFYKIRIHFKGIRQTKISDFELDTEYSMWYGMLNSTMIPVSHFFKEYSMVFIQIIDFIQNAEANITHLVVSEVRFSSIK
jgi:hypothetical protein